MKRHGADAPQLDDGRSSTVRQLALLAFAIAVAFILIPVGSWAAASGPIVFVTDPDNTNNKAHVDGQGNLQVTGNLNVANTPTVKAQQEGEWNVGIAGTPTVDVGNCPSTQDVTVTGGTVSAEIPVISAQESEHFTLASLEDESRSIPEINASLITVEGGGDDEVEILFTNGPQVGPNLGFAIGDDSENLGPF